MIFLPIINVILTAKNYYQIAINRFQEYVDIQFEGKSL